MTDKEKVMNSYDDETPESFLKEVMYECRGVSRSEMITIRKQAAVHAQSQVDLNSGFEAREWRKLAFNLRSNRI